jgi:ABC-type multidrug transport system ATPase subunit
VNALPLIAEAASPTVATRLECRDLAHRYGRRVGLATLSFTLTSPGLAAVMGPNGSGKSTLLRILAGLLRPSEGQSSLSIEGREITPATRRRFVGFASPTLAFYEELSVHENLGFAAEAMELRERDAAVRDALERVGLDARRDDRVASLSSGLVQRLRLAFALLQRPKVLLLDEPGNHLDEAGQAMLTELLRDESRRALVVLATNDSREWTLAERRIELGPGLGHSA